MITALLGIALLADPANSSDISQLVEALKAEQCSVEQLMGSRAIRETPGTRACRALARIGDEAIEPVAALLTDQSPIVRQNAISTLSAIGKLQARKAILRAIDDGDATVRAFAVSHLRTMVDPVIRKAICGVLKDAEMRVRIAALQQLAFVDRMPPSHEQLSNVQRNELIAAVASLAADDHAEVRLEVGRTLGSYRNGNCLKALLGLLKDRDAAVRAMAAQGLGASGNRQASASLLGALADQADSVAAQAAGALGELEEPLAVVPLVERLKSHASIRRVLAEALGRIGDRRAVEPLVGLLDDPEPRVRIAAMESLSLIGDLRAVDPLIARLGRSSDETPDLARALGRFNDARAVAPLVKAMFAQPDNQYVADAATAALKAIRDPSVVRVLAEHSVAQSSTFAGFAARRMLSRTLSLGYDFDAEGFDHWWQANKALYAPGK